MSPLDLDYDPAFDIAWCYPEPTDEEVDAEMERAARGYRDFFHHRDTNHHGHVLELEAKLEREFVGPPNIDLPF